MEEDLEVTGEALGPLDYLTSSVHRVQVLEALTETIPKPGQDGPGLEPRELRDATDASDATVSRILNEFEERGWAQRDTSGAYAATPTGRSIAIGFAPLLDSMAAIDHLGDAVALLPLNELTIGLEHFRDATVREPTGPQPQDLVHFTTEMLSDSSTFDGLIYVPGTGGLIDEMTDQIAAGTLDSTQVLAERIVEFYVETAGDHGRKQVRDHLEAGAEWYMYDGHVPCNIYLFDETVAFENSQVDGLKDGTAIVSQDPVVREWARGVFERYKEESTEITVDDLPV